MAKPSGLGKGIGALISQRPMAAAVTAPQPGERILQLKLAQIVPSPLQPRTEFHPSQLEELISSIRERGIIQPLIVRTVNGRYELIAGERRWRAAKEVGLSEAPAIVREASDREVLELALVENLQREDLNAIEEAHAYARLSREFAMTQEEIAQRVGKNRATVANSMRLLDLAEEVQGFLSKGLISVGHAKVLLSVKGAEEQKHLAGQILRQGLPVRAAEKLVAQFLAQSNRTPKAANKKRLTEPAMHAPSLQRMENMLQQRLSTRVLIHHKEKHGTIHIEYYGADDLTRVLALLGVSDLD
jgi:ParB family chromosome partitioning protein